MAYLSSSDLYLVLFQIAYFSVYDSFTASFGQQTFGKFIPLTTSLPHIILPCNRRGISDGNGRLKFERSSNRGRHWEYTTQDPDSPPWTEHFSSETYKNIFYYEALRFRLAY